MRIVVGSGNNRKEVNRHWLDFMINLNNRLNYIMATPITIGQPETVDRIIVEIELKP